MAASLPSGTYALVWTEDLHLAVRDGAKDPGTPVVMMTPIDAYEQRWEVLDLPDGSVTVRNLASNTYLGFEGDAEPNVLLGGFPQETTWQLVPGEEPDRLAFALVPPEAPDLHLGRGIQRLWPPRAGLLTSIGGTAGAAASALIFERHD